MFLFVVFIFCRKKACRKIFKQGTGTYLFWEDVWIWGQFFLTVFK